jgi:hypothetical protein
MSELRERIFNTISVGHEALPDKDGVLLCACGSYFDDKAEHGVHVADAVIAELGLRQEWATEQSLLLGIVKLTKPDDAIAMRVGSAWKETTE